MSAPARPATSALAGWAVLARLGILLGTSTCMACSGTPRPTPTDSPALATSSSPSAGVALAAPTASASASSEPAPGPSPFREVAAALPLELYAIDGTLAGVHQYFDPEKQEVTHRVFVLRGDTFELLATRQANPMLLVYQSLIGAADGPLDFVGLRPTARTAYPFVDTLVGTRASDPGGMGSIVNLATRDGATYGIVSGMFYNSLSQLRGKRSDLSQAAAPETCHGVQGMPRVFADTFVASRKGDLLASGTTCDGSTAIEVWKRGAASSELITPAVDGALYAAPGGDAYLVGKQIAKWDGTRFVPLEPAPPHPATSAFETADGSTWMTANVSIEKNRSELGLFVRRDGRWNRVGLPDAKVLAEVLFDGKVLWARGGPKLELFRLASAGETPPRVALKPKDETMLAALDEGAPLPPAPSFKPGGPKCTTNVVVLYGFTKVTPLEYDFPLTRKAITGHTELTGVKFAVTLDAGKRYFVGLTPSFEMARTLSTVIEKGVQGSKPQVVCAEPEIVRELAIDLTTGDVKR